MEHNYLTAALEEEEDMRGVTCGTPEKCNHRSPTGLLTCVRIKGHSGNHLAWKLKELGAVVWDR